MRILYVADGRSPIALNWISYFVAGGHEVHLVSGYPCKPGFRLSSLTILPLPFTNRREMGGDISTISESRLTSVLRQVLPVGSRTLLRQWLVPLSLPNIARRLQETIKNIKPDLIHAMRIPFEGMLVAIAQPEFPVIVSVWGNDFTLHANANPLMRRYTRLVLQKAAFLHTDCQRDQHLAYSFGYPDKNPAVVLPGAGGVQLEIFYPRLASRTPMVINPRGFRAYVRNDTFFKAIPLVVRHIPDMHFICPAMAGETVALNWIEKLGIASSVDLLPSQTRSQMAELFRQSQITLSITTHDGTPNTLLEGMASGCFPIVGDIETMHEWITPGVNGILISPDDPRALADAILASWEKPELRAKAAKINRKLVEDKADFQKVMMQAEELYRVLIH